MRPATRAADYGARVPALAEIDVGGLLLAMISRRAATGVESPFQAFRRRTRLPTAAMPLSSSRASVAGSDSGSGTAVTAMLPLSLPMAALLVPAPEENLPPGVAQTSTGSEVNCVKLTEPPVPVSTMLVKSSS